MAVKYKNYECLLIRKDKKTYFGCDYLSEATNLFKTKTTIIQMVVWKATHNNTRLKIYRTYKEKDRELL